MTYDLWLMIYNSSLVTITSDHHSWPSGLITWLLTHDFSPMAIKVFSTMTRTYQRWLSLPWPSSMSMSSSLTTTISHLWLLTQRPWPPYDHEVSSMTIRTLTHDHQDTHPWPSGHSPMTIRMVTNVHFVPLLWSAHMDYSRGEYDVHSAGHVHCDRLIHCAWWEYEGVWENESVITSH